MLACRVAMARSRLRVLVRAALSASTLLKSPLPISSMPLLSFFTSTCSVFSSVPHGYWLKVSLPLASVHLYTWAAWVLAAANNSKIRLHLMALSLFNRQIGCGVWLGPSGTARALPGCRRHNTPDRRCGGEMCQAVERLFVRLRLAGIGIFAPRRGSSNRARQRGRHAHSEAAARCRPRV